MLLFSVSTILCFTVILKAFVLKNKNKEKVFIIKEDTRRVMVAHTFNFGT